MGYHRMPVTPPDHEKRTEMTTTEFTVTGMTCGHCEQAIRDEVDQVPGVIGVEVSTATGLLSVTTDGLSIDASAILKAVEEAGYTALPV
jgi:copper chaperone